MRRSIPLLASLLLAAGCDDEPAPIEPSLPGSQSHLVVCTGQEELGDTWQLALAARAVQLDDAGNVYLTGSHAAPCAANESFSGSWTLLTKIGAKGDVQWVRGWSEHVAITVAPSGEAMAVGEERVDLVGADGAILVQRPAGTPPSAIGAAEGAFLFAGSYAHEDRIAFGDWSFETASRGGLFVITLDRQLVPYEVRQPPPYDAAVSEVLAVAALSDGDLVNVHHDIDAGNRLTISRSGARSWAVTDLERTPEATLHVLDDDSIVVHAGPRLSRYADDGVLLWSRDYRDALPYEANRTFSSNPAGGGRIVAATNGAALTIAFMVRSDSAIETSDGPVVPDGADIGFAQIDVASGLPLELTLEPLAGHQHATAAAMAADGSLVVATSSDEPGAGSGYRLTRHATTLP